MRDVGIANENSIGEGPGGEPLPIDRELGVQLVNSVFIFNAGKWIEDLDTVYSKVLAGLDADPDEAERIAA